MMIRASNVVKFLQRPLLEFLNGLACGARNHPSNTPRGPLRDNPRSRHGHESILA
jgi:hypothetical protein